MAAVVLVVGVELYLSVLVVEVGVVVVICNLVEYRMYLVGTVNERNASFIRMISFDRITNQLKRKIALLVELLFNPIFRCIKLPVVEVVEVVAVGRLAIELVGTSYLVANMQDYQQYLIEVEVEVCTLVLEVALFVRAQS